MTSFQQNVYEKILHSSASYLKKNDLHGVHESKSDSVDQLSASEVNHLFSSLRKAANHPLLLRVRYSDPNIIEIIAQVAYANDYFGNQTNYDRVRAEICDMSDFDIHYLCLTYPDTLSKYSLSEDALYDSPKMKWLQENLPKLVEQKHRILIFSQWTRILDLITVLLDALSMSYLRLDGSTPIKTRQEYIDQFYTDLSIPVFLLSTKAGGLGINLCAADTVILHDLGELSFVLRQLFSCLLFVASLVIHTRGALIL
jgi:SWI/SNF-related matrix-associated actin-dependent regulator of chromatin subfamily A containing DEAD/H box 1